MPIEGGGEDAALTLVIGIRGGVGAALDLLGDQGDLHVGVAVDLDQRVVERVGRIDGVLHLLGAAPALGGALLEQTERVPVAVREIAQVGLLQGGGQGDGGGAGG